MLLSVGDLRLAVHIPVPHRGHDAQFRCHCLHRYIEPHLIVALPGAAVPDGCRPLGPRYLRQLAGDERPGQGSGEGVLPLIDGPSRQRREREVARERFLGLPPYELGRSRFQRPRLSLLTRPLHAHIHRKGDHFVAALLL